MKWRYDWQRGYLHVSHFSDVKADLAMLRRVIQREQIRHHIAAIIFRVTDEDILFLRGSCLCGWLEWKSRYE